MTALTMKNTVARLEVVIFQNIIEPQINDLTFSFLFPEQCFRFTMELLF